MQREELRINNGHDGRALERAPRAGAMEPEGAGGLGDVAKDALNHLKVIVNDTVAIGKLEARRVAQRAEETGREIVPRLAAGVTASIVGLAGVVLALIALFIALGEVIPSVAVRLGIYAAAFLLIAGVAGFFALRPRKSHRVEEPPPEKIAPPAPYPVANGRVDLAQISR